MPTPDEFAWTHIYINKAPDLREIALETAAPSKVQSEGYQLLNAALDKSNPAAFRDELAKITDPTEQREAIQAAKDLEKQREEAGKNDPNLPKVEFFDSQDKLSTVKVENPATHNSRVAYDAHTK